MSGTRVGRRWDPDSLAALEHERSLMLRELRELEVQYRNGEVGPAQHAALADELTARTAEVIAAIERGRAARPARPRRRRGVALGLAIGVAAALLGVGWILVGELAPRAPANTVFTGAATLEQRIARLATAVAERPQDGPARLAYARLLLQQQNLPEALIQYDAAARLDPANAEALAYGGWMAVLTGSDAEGRERLDRAVAADPGYPDAHALRGLALRRGGDDGAAIEEFRRYLELAPGGPFAAQVESVITRMGGGR